MNAAVYVGLSAPPAASAAITTTTWPKMKIAMNHTTPESTSRGPHDGSRDRRSGVVGVRGGSGDSAESAICGQYRQSHREARTYATSIRQRRTHSNLPTGRRI